MKKREMPSGPETPEWVVTFSDIISLLVTFFVLLLTYNAMTNKKFDRVKGGLKGAFGVLDSDKEEEVSLESRATPFAKDHLERFSEIPGVQDQDEDKEPLSYEQKLRLDEQSCFRLKTEITFAAGSSRLSPEAQPILESLANLLRHTRIEASIKGFAHVENGAVKRGYSLAARRAFVVWRYLVNREKIAPERLNIVSCLSNDTTNPEEALARKNKEAVEVILWNNDKIFARGR